MSKQARGVVERKRARARGRAIEVYIQAQRKSTTHKQGEENDKEEK